MKYKYLLYLIICFSKSKTVFAQNSCVDTFENKSLYNEGLKYIERKISTPILVDDSGLIFCAGAYLVKQNIDKTLGWKKQINKIVDTRFKKKDNSILGLFNFEPSGPSTGDRGFTKIDKNGNIAWAKKITAQNNLSNNYALIYNTSKGKKDDIIISSIATLQSFNIVVLDSSANAVKINKTINFSLPNNDNIIGINQTTDSNNIYVAVIIDHKQLSPTKIYNYLLLLKFDYATGNLISTAYYNFTDIFLLNNVPLQGMLFSNFLFEIKNNYLKIAGRKATDFYDNKRFYSIKIDTNLQVIKSTIYKYPTGFNFRYSNDVLNLPSIDNEGNILFAHIKDSSVTPLSSNNCYYFMVDDEDNLIMQRKQQITQTGLVSAGFNLNVVSYLQNKNKGKIIYHTNSSQFDSVIHIVDIAKDINTNNCMGVESNLLTVETPSYNILTAPTIASIVPFPITMSPYILTSQNINVDDRKFCTQISKCDSIKINGASNYCLSTDTATFTLFKNAQCLRKTGWIVDTNFIKILSQPNDTTLIVKFLSSFSGFIKAGFKGCTLKDSLFISVNKPMQSLNLGKDTFLCPNKTIILNAKEGFISYKWQDNSTDSTFTANQPGQYYVTAIDSCNTIFSDTIIVKPLDTVFDLQFPNSICKYDSAFIKLPTTLNNYVFTPSNFGIIENNLIKLFPENSTLFNIKADRFVGCTLSDTLLIKVVECPIYFYIPSAFSPNNDYLNETFKPLISGKLEKYLFSIYNRYGQLIFNSTNTNEGWNGKIKGSPQASGAFTWTCYYKFKKQKEIQKKGTFLLIK